MKPESQLRPIPAEVYEKIGRLCSGWAYLEFRTEQLIWGITGVDAIAGRDLTWRLSMLQRWELVRARAPDKHDEPDLVILRALGDRIGILAKDRNIVVHGLVHTKVRDPITDGGKIAIGGIIEQVPAWTIFRGSDAGKNFPISVDAVQIIYDNILKTSAEVVAFNDRHGYTLAAMPDVAIQEQWPAKL